MKVLPSPPASPPSWTHWAHIVAEGAKEAAKLKISDLTGSRKMSGSSWADPCSTAEEAAGVPSGDTNQGVVVGARIMTSTDEVGFTGGDACPWEIGGGDIVSPGLTRAGWLVGREGLLLCAELL